MKKRKIKQPYSLWSNLKYVWKEIRVIGNIYYVYAILYLLSLVFTPFMITILPGLVVSLIQSNEAISYIMGGIVVMLLCILIGNTLMIVCKRKLEWAGLLMRLVYFNFLFGEKLLACDYTCVEGKENRDQLAEVRHMFNSGAYEEYDILVMQPLQLLAYLLGFLLYSLIVSSLELWILGLLIMVMMINYVIQVHARNYEFEHMKEFWQNNDRFWYLKKESTEIRKGKDMRIYQLQDMFSEMFTQNTQEAKQIYQSVNRHTTFANIGVRMTSLLRDVIMYSYLMIQMSKGHLEIGEFIIYVGVVYGFSQWLEKIVNSYAASRFSSMLISNFRSFLAKKDRSHGDQIVPSQVHEIVFENVSFGYDHQPLLFQNFHLTIHPYEKLALVGINGAGKTTLMKLLCNLYPLKEGRILIDGVDINAYDLTSYFKEIAIVFQDIHQFAFSIASFVTCSLDEDMIKESLKEFDEIKHGKELIQYLNKKVRDINPYDEERLIYCLKEAGLWNKINSLPKGIHTNLSKMLDQEGVLLSGGEMQKLMLARALYKDGNILILDEPTAALDPIAESAMYENYANLCKDKTSIFISHRLSSTKFCDRIIFLEQGQIIEEGTHEELLQSDGKYAQMFHVQSHYYQQEVDVNEAYMEYL